EAEPGAESAPAVAETPPTQPTATETTTTVVSGSVGTGGAREDVPSVQTLIQTQRVAIASGDYATLVGTLAPSAIGFGVDADELGEGREALRAHVVHDLGDPPANGFTVVEKLATSGEANGHAWIALEL